MVGIERLLALLAVVFFAIAGSHDAGLTPPDWIADSAYWWHTPDQAGAERYAEGDFIGASRHFRDAAWRGAACFRAGDHACAEAAFAEADIDAADRHFNLGNTAARRGNFERAIIEYDAALGVRPDWASAAENRRIVLDLVVQRSRRPAAKDSAERGEPTLEPDEADIERRMRGKAGRIEVEGIDPNAFAQLWLRQIRSDAGEFLRLRFADEVTRRDTPAQGEKQ